MVDVADRSRLLVRVVPEAGAGAIDKACYNVEGVTGTDKGPFFFNPRRRACEK